MASWSSSSSVSAADGGLGGSVTHDPPHLDVGRPTPFWSAIAPARRACGTHGGSVTRDPPYGCEPVSGAIPRIRGVDNTFPGGHGTPRGVRGGSVRRDPPYGCEPVSGAIPRLRGVDNTFPGGHGTPRGVLGGPVPRDPPYGCEPMRVAQHLLFVGWIKHLAWRPWHASRRARRIGTT